MGDQELEEAGGSGKQDPLRWEESGEVGYWDLCFVFAGCTPPHENNAQKLREWRELQTKRGQLLEKLHNAGLMLSKRVSAEDPTTHSYLVSAKLDRLELQAELIQMQLQMQPRHGGGYTEFTRKDKGIFLHAYDDDFFTRTQRQHLVRTIIENNHYNGGCDISIHASVKQGVISKAFPFHDSTTKKYLRRVWAHFRVRDWWKPQPLHILRDYFGEELALYFAYLEFYNSALFIPMVVGIIVMGLSFVDGSQGWPNTIYAFYMMLWTTVFLEFWKRHQNTLAFAWNMLEFEENEESRADYVGTKSLGVHMKGQWISFNKNDPALEHVHLVPTLHYPRKWNRMKMAFSWLPLMLVLMVVIFVAFCILGVRLFLQRRLPGPWGGIVGGILGAVLIIVFNLLYRGLAVSLNDWENHRTQTEHDDALIVKSILFQFVNTFTSLYFIAFRKNSFDWFGLETNLNIYNFHDTCQNPLPSEDDSSGSVIGGGCISELMVQLGMLMAVNLIVGQTKEILIPLVKVAINKFLKSKDKSAQALLKKAQPWDAQRKLVDFEGTFDEYAEMVMQYAMVTVFSPAFPLAPLAALLNNWVEIRTDAIKILNTNNKPWYKGAQDIGGWYRILDIIGYLAVVTNCLLVGLGYAAIPNLVGIGKYGRSFNTLVFCVVIEHLLVVLKFVIAETIPDMPGRVQKELARQEFFKRETLKNLSELPHFHFTEPSAKDFTYAETYPDGQTILPGVLKVTFGVKPKDLLSPVELDDLGSPRKKKKDKKNKGAAATPSTQLERGEQQKDEIWSGSELPVVVGRRGADEAHKVSVQRDMAKSELRIEN